MSERDKPKMGFSLWAMPANSEFLVAAMTTKPCEGQLKCPYLQKRPYDSPRASEPACQSGT